MESLMKHFAVEEWIDFVNHVARTIRREKMKEHLEQGCKRCSKIVSQWQRVRQTAETETNYRPPRDAVRIAKASLAGSNSTVEQKRRTALLSYSSMAFCLCPKAFDHRAFEQDTCSIAQTPFRLIC